MRNKGNKNVEGIIYHPRLSRVQRGTFNNYAHITGLNWEYFD